MKLYTSRMLPLVLAALCGSALAQWNPAAVETFVRTEMERQKIPGLSLAIVRNGEVLVSRGFGLANVEHQVPVRMETIFQSGSVGKQITAAAVMLLVEEGKIALDDPVTKYFPEAPAAWAPITIRHLLTHTSGIPDYTAETINYRRDYTEEELEKMAFGLELEFPAGSRWNYSNTGYVLLGILIGKVSGQFYGDLLQDCVFAPLGMTTARVITEEEIVPHRAAGYRLERGTLKNQRWVAPRLNTTADGSLYLSILDLIAWDKGLRSQAVLKPESWALVFRPVRLNSGNPYPYGFGWSVEQLAGQTRLHHGGAWQGFKAYLSRYLGDDMTVMVLANLADADPGAIVDGIAALMNPKLAKAELTPIEDREPAVRARLEALLAAIREGRLSPEEFAYVRAGFFPEGPRRYQQRLAGVGAIQRIELLERRVLGDDRVYTYEVTGAGAVLRIRLGLAPDDKISQFDLRLK